MVQIDGSKKRGPKRRVEIDRSKWTGQIRWVQIDRSKYMGQNRRVQKYCFPRFSVTRKDASFLLEIYLFSLGRLMEDMVPAVQVYIYRYFTSGLFTK